MVPLCRSVATMIRRNGRSVGVLGEGPYDYWKVRWYAFGAVPTTRLKCRRMS